MPAQSRINAANLQVARQALRPAPSGGIKKETLPESHNLFAKQAQPSAWDAMDPCRVSPVWNAAPQLADYEHEKLLALGAGLEKLGHRQAQIVPMLAGYCGAVLFSLQSERGTFFVKAVLNEQDASAKEKLAKEYAIGKALAQANVTASFDGYQGPKNAKDPGVAFFVSSLLGAKPLEAEPFRSELFTLAAGKEAGPFLQQLLALMRGFHKTQDASLLAMGPWRREPLAGFGKVMRQAENKNLFVGSELQELHAFLQRLTKAYDLRGSALPKNQVFAHADMHASNVRWDPENKRLFAIDFGDSGAGDPARELAYFLFMMDVPMALASPLVRLYQREVTPYPEAFYERTLLALASERIIRYVKILGWGGRTSQAAQDYQRRIVDDLPRVASWL